MRRIPACCVVLFLAGCGGREPKVPEPPEPINGICGAFRDTCRSGRPVETGDTSSPYEWTCEGQFGGENDYCSVPTAKIEEEEIFAGQNALVEKIKAAGPLRGKLLIIDEEESNHGRIMKEVALEDMGVPEQNLVFGWDILLTDSQFRETLLDQEVLTVAVPTTYLVVHRERWLEDSLAAADRIARHKVLFVYSAGNTETDRRRDIWYPDHPNWERHSWEAAFAFFATGKVIIAKHVRLDEKYTVVPDEGNVKCGHAKEFCYSVIHSDRRPYRGSSGASVRLGALTYYLFQLWDTPRAVINTLNSCAEDVGEPGIDEEFGRGVVSVICDRVQNRERAVVASSLRTFAASPVLNQMIGAYENIRTPRSLSSQSLSPLESLPMSEWFRPFYAVRGYNVETVAGYLGGQFSLRGTDLFIAGGADYTPLGVRSSLLHAGRTPFTEFGVRRNLLSHDGHQVSLLGSYGYSEGRSMSAHVGSLGGEYGYRFNPSSVLSLYAGNRAVYGFLGIPGYRQAGADLVPFADNAPEVRLSFTLSR